MEKMIPNTTETTTATPAPAKTLESKPKTPKVSLYIEPSSEKVKTTAAVEHHNFEILKNELNILRGNMPAGKKVLLVPLGGKCEDCLKSFIAWLPEEDRAWIAVPPMYMAHYSQAGWNNQLSKDRVVMMKSWCDEHIILSKS